MRIKIYQIDGDKDTKRVKFLRYDLLKKYQGTKEIDAALYMEVFSGKVEPTTLEGVYTAFNTEPQPLHRGHSLSVSDIVVTEDGAYYCDSIGFRKVNFDESKAQKPANLLKVVYIEPKKAAYIAEVADTLRDLQRAVGGRIKLIDNDDGTGIVCSQEAKLQGMKGNRRLGNGKSVIAGPFFVVGLGEEDFRALTDEEIQKYIDRFSMPEEISNEEVEADTGYTFIPLD